MTPTISKIERSREDLAEVEARIGRAERMGDERRAADYRRAAADLRDLIERLADAEAN